LKRQGCLYWGFAAVWGGRCGDRTRTEGALISSSMRGSSMSEHRAGSRDPSAKRRAVPEGHGRLIPRLDAYGRAFLFAGHCSGTKKVLPARPVFAGHPRQTTGKRDPHMSRGSLGAIKRRSRSVARERGATRRGTPAGKGGDLRFFCFEPSHKKVTMGPPAGKGIQATSFLELPP